jgi:hypothetical protein
MTNGRSRARSRLVHWHDRGHVRPSKKMAPESLPRQTRSAHGVHPAALPSWFHIVTAIGAVKPPTVTSRPGKRSTLITPSRAHFISTVTVSVQLHKLHSKVRTSGPSSPDTTPVSIIGPWHFGHGGRSISAGLRSARGCGMCCSARSGESATLSVTDECRVWDGDNNAANSIQFHEDSRSSRRKRSSVPSQVRWRARRGTMHLPNADGTTRSAVILGGKTIIGRQN